MSSGRVIVRACGGGAGRAPWKGDELTRPVHARVEDRG